jgi:uncharacterized membrane protein
MKITLKDFKMDYIVTLIMAVVVWLCIIPLAWMATPFILLAHYLGISNSSEAIEMLKDFYTMPHQIYKDKK